MLTWALAFFLVALVAALFGFTAIALAAAGVVDSSDKAKERNKGIRESARGGRSSHS
jgi:Flp pilus assembly protein TadB